MDAIGYEASRRLGMEYAHSSFYVELYMNGDYQGIYLVTEHKEINHGRIPIARDNNSLFIEMDAYFDEEYKFMSDILSLPVMIKHPESNAGVENAKVLINGLEELLFSENYLANWNTINDILDINSLINFMLVQEITRNTESRWPKSVLMYRDATPNSKLIFGPVWDFDWGFSYNPDENIYFNVVDGLVFYKGANDGPPGSDFLVVFLNFLNF